VPITDPRQAAKHPQPLVAPMTARGRRVPGLPYTSLIEVRDPVNEAVSAGRCALECVWSVRGPSSCLGHPIFCDSDPCCPGFFQGFLVFLLGDSLPGVVTVVGDCFALYFLYCCMLRSVLLFFNLHGVNGTVLEYLNLSCTDNLDECPGPLSGSTKLPPRSQASGQFAYFLYSLPYPSPSLLLLLHHQDILTSSWLLHTLFLHSPFSQVAFFCPTSLHSFEKLNPAKSTFAPFTRPNQAHLVLSISLSS
jgi:hypothetical protein